MMTLVYMYTLFHHTSQIYPETPVKSCLHSYDTLASILQLSLQYFPKGSLIDHEWKHDSHTWIQQ